MTDSFAIDISNLSLIVYSALYEFLFASSLSLLELSTESYVCLENVISSHLISVQMFSSFTEFLVSFSTHIICTSSSSSKKSFQLKRY